MLTIVLMQAVLLVQLGLIMVRFYREMSAVLFGSKCCREDITEAEHCNKDATENINVTKNKTTRVAVSQQFLHC
ncbi:hypothetical protein EOPP23_02690 [Endozoicomonas sp. OPT23]|nr:hypothetical protein [Endozoicomonas sp. OPT23]